MRMSLGLVSSFSIFDQRKRCSDGGGLKIIKRVPGSVWGWGSVYARSWVVGMHLAKMTDDVLKRGEVCAFCRSELEKDFAN